jgi:hypothetical protein
MTKGGLYQSLIDQIAEVLREEDLTGMRRGLWAVIEGCGWPFPAAVMQAVEAADKPQLEDMLRASVSAADLAEFAERFGIDLDKA